MSEIITDQERLSRAVGSLRNMIRDKKPLNKLLLGENETSDEEARQAIISAVLDWNSTPPLIAPVTLKNHPNKYLLLQCAALQCLTSSGIWHSREHMPSSDGGTSADDHAKAGEYTGWIDRYTAAYEKQKSDLKTAINIAAALNGMSVSSEYAWLGAAENALYGYSW